MKVYLVYTTHVHITCFDSAQVVVDNLEMGRDFIIFLSSFARKILQHMELHSRYSSEVWWKPFQKIYHHPSAIHQLTQSTIAGIKLAQYFRIGAVHEAREHTVRMTVKNCTSLTSDFHPVCMIDLYALCMYFELYLHIDRLSWLYLHVQKEHVV